MIGKLAKSRRCVWICAVAGRLLCTRETAASTSCSVSEHVDGPVEEEVDLAPSPGS